MERDGTRLHCDSSDLLILSAVQISELADHQWQGNLSLNFDVVDIDRCDVVVVVVVKHTYLPSKSGWDNTIACHQTVGESSFACKNKWDAKYLIYLTLRARALQSICCYKKNIEFLKLSLLRAHITFLIMISHLMNSHVFKKNCCKNVILPLLPKLWQ